MTVAPATSTSRPSSSTVAGHDGRWDRSTSTTQRLLDPRGADSYHRPRPAVTREGTAMDTTFSRREAVRYGLTLAAMGALPSTLFACRSDDESAPSTTDPTENATGATSAPDTPGELRQPAVLKSDGDALALTLTAMPGVGRHRRGQAGDARSPTTARCPARRGSSTPARPCASTSSTISRRSTTPSTSRATTAPTSGRPPTSTPTACTCRRRATATTSSSTIEPGERAPLRDRGARRTTRAGSSGTTRTATAASPSRSAAGWPGHDRRARRDRRGAGGQGGQGADRGDPGPSS